MNFSDDMDIASYYGIDADTYNAYLESMDEEPVQTVSTSGPELEVERIARQQGTGQDAFNDSVIVESEKWDYEDLQVPEDNEWHGYKVRNHGSIHIGYLPSRKSVALYIVNAGVLKPLAFFKSENEARIALKWLDILTQTFCLTEY